MAGKEEGQTPRKNTNVSKPRGQGAILEHLGVTDLREVLDRKRHEKSHVTETVPPPDPSFSYLKDPLRDNSYEQPTTSRRPQRRDKSNSKNQDIESPCNIKVEFSTETGQHSYKLDENTVLPTIKHVPDRFERPSRGRGRGRGRGQGQGQNGQRTYYTRTIRNNNMRPKVEEPPEENWDDECNPAKAQNDSLAKGLENLQINDKKKTGDKGTKSQ